MKRNEFQLLPDEKAAALLDTCAQTLRNWRGQGRGPSYIKIGRNVRYRLGDLEKYIENNRIDPKNHV